MKFFLQERSPHQLSVNHVYSKLKGHLLLKGQWFFRREFDTSDNYLVCVVIIFCVENETGSTDR